MNYSKRVFNTRGYSAGVSRVSKRASQNVSMVVPKFTEKYMEAVDRESPREEYLCPHFNKQHSKSFPLHMLCFFERSFSSETGRELQRVFSYLYLTVELEASIQYDTFILHHHQELG
jgi:hypothetical protein